MTQYEFFTSSQQLSVDEVASLTGALLQQAELGSSIISDISTIDRATAGCVVFVDSKKFIPAVKQTKAGAIFCTQELVGQLPAGVAALVVSDPHRAFCALGRILYPQSVKPTSLLGHGGISAQAIIDPSVKLGQNVTVEAGAVIGKGVVIGDNTTISAGVVVGENCKIGADCFLGPGVSVYCAVIGDRVHLYSGVRIGQDGFGYVGGKSGPEKVPHLGRVLLHNDVEIGANTTIDRGGLEDTIIGSATKIDNLVQIAHNVQIGKNCVIAAHTGIAGSVRIGDMTALGGRVGIKDHITIGSRVQIAAASGVMNDIPDGEKWGGIPARPFKQWFREVAALRNIGKSSRERP